MQYLFDLINTLNGIVWGLPMIIMILGTGLYLQIRLRFMPIRKIAQGFRMIWKSRAPGAAAAGEISPFAALIPRAPFRPRSGYAPRWSSAGVLSVSVYE